MSGCATGLLLHTTAGRGLNGPNLSSGPTVRSSALSPSEPRHGSHLVPVIVLSAQCEEDRERFGSTGYKDDRPASLRMM